MVVAEISFSTLLREPHRVTAQLAGGDVVLHRRDGEDLYLSVKSRAERDAESATQAARILGALVHTPEGQLLIINVLDEAFPWTRLLTGHGREQFVSEFVATARACADVGVWTPLGQLLHEWKATAAIQPTPTCTQLSPLPCPTTITARSLSRT
ncbi:MAG: hypothetical protein GEV03_04410 [Streptosporangiales bacterium]|nr:hypothetical protein [Streptosporangiales bacterium]